MSNRRLTRSYAHANLEGPQPAATQPAEEQIWTQARNANDTDSDCEDALSTPKGPKHGRPTADSERAKTAAPLAGLDIDKCSHGSEVVRKPTVVNRRAIPPRSPLPLRAKRPVNPGAPDMVKPREGKRTRNKNNTDSEHDDALGIPKGRKRGRLAANTDLSKTAAGAADNDHSEIAAGAADTNLSETEGAADTELSKTAASLDIDSSSHSTKEIVRKHTIVIRKAVPPRSPLPPRAKRPINPGAPDMVKPKRSSAEVTAAAERKAALQDQADRLEQKRIETLAEMEIEEELEENAEEEHTVVRKLARTESLDDVEDTIMQFDDGEDKGSSFADGNSEFCASEENNKLVDVNKVAPKVQMQTQVCPFGSSDNVAKTMKTT